MSKYDYLFDNNRQSDEPRWFRDELDARVRNALDRTTPNVPIERSKVEPEYLLSTNPSQATAIVIDGKEIGIEHLTEPADAPGYRAVMFLDHKLPPLQAAGRRSLRTSAAGPRALTGDHETDARVAFFTTAPRFPRALLRHEGFARAFASALPFGPRLEIVEYEERSDLTVQLAFGDPAGVRAGMTLAREFHAAARAGAGDPDATAVIAIAQNLEAPEQIEDLMGALVEATHWLAGAVARVGRGVEARLTLDEGGGTFEGTLGATLESAGVRLVLRAAVPRDIPPFELKPQRGARAFFARLREQRIGDPAVDEAFLISTTDDGIRALHDARNQLARLAEHTTRLKGASETLHLEVDGIPSSAADIADAGSAALEVWRGLIARARY